MNKVRVLIVDDSALMRQLLTEILTKDPHLEVVGTAGDPYVARDKIMTLNPDVITLDVEMPRMDGLTFLEKLMASRPLPVVMVSSLTERGCQTTLRALELGAVDFVAKPKGDISTGMRDLARELVLKIRGASSAKVRPRSRSAQSPAEPIVKTQLQSSSLITGSNKVVVIGASTGGTEAMAEVLTKFPSDGPGVIATIHMPPGYTKSYAERLDRCCQVHVKEAVNGDRIQSGQVLIAPGDFHMEAVRSGSGYNVHISSGEKVSGFRPSVDVLFRSAARAIGSNAVGIILTGMGSDGALGMLEMKKSGAQTIAQDEATSVVFGMPREAISKGGVDFIRPLQRIADQAIACCKGQPAMA
ncbi:MAG: chemotaxis response regulator protein-glutamate methylesterase [Planctomycetaceae bacterium]|nr:chemotaxis response regulator protein-glutamate methylesterase [Planctomycetaceae bacterium]